MKRTLAGLAAALTLAATGSAYGDCAADLAQLEGQMTSQPSEGISKDGSVAPMEDGAADAAPAGGSAAGMGDAAGKIAKDGSTAPLEMSGGEDTQTAMSGQDVEAQQQGEPTAAATADAGSGADGHAAAMTEARAALDRGDEAACAAAIEKAKAS